MAFFAYLVRRGFANVIDVGFLLQGHTHTVRACLHQQTRFLSCCSLQDIDQKFSNLRVLWNRRSCWNLPEFVALVKEAYQNSKVPIEVILMTCYFDIRSYLQLDAVSIPGISEYRRFVIRRKDDGTAEARVKLCFARCYANVLKADSSLGSQVYARGVYR